MPSDPAPLPCIAAVGGACYHCYAQPPVTIKLPKCSGCLLVSYCNSACQDASWPAHKKFCRSIASFEKLPFVLSIVKWVGASTPAEVRDQTTERINFCRLQLGRDFSSHEMTLLRLEPRCLYCARTNQLIRIEASVDPSIAPHTLIPCSRCKLSFACEAHWELVDAEHTQMMCEGGYDGLPQCVLNQELLEDDEWDATMRRLPPLPQYSAPLNTYRWIPARLGPWKSLKNATWAGKFQAQLESEFPAARAAPSVWLRRMSDILCMPMTVLYALECLNDDLAWTKKDMLTIHVIGAQSKELWHATCHENILHQLPEVKIVKVVFCGVLLESKLADDMRGGPYEIICCPDCEARGRWRFNEYYDVHYHTLPQTLGGRYSVPDLAIAFNSGASEPLHNAAWKQTIAFLVARGIPSLFTTYTQGEALADNRMIVDAGAKLLPELGPARNPWGSMLGKRDLGLPRKFYSDNMCLAGGFKGGV